MPHFSAARPVPATDQSTLAAALDPTITKNGDHRAMATGSGPTFEQKMDRLLAAAHDCGAWLRFRTVRPETTHSSASGDVAHDELILTLPDGRWEGRVANSGAGRRMGCARPQFHTLLTSGRPKQSASSRFCSRTVHAPAKPKPLRSHSIASKTWIVRRAVWKAWKQPTRGMGRFTRK